MGLKYAHFWQLTQFRYHFNLDWHYHQHTVLTIDLVLLNGVDISVKYRVAPVVKPDTPRPVIRRHTINSSNDEQKETPNMPNEIRSIPPVSSGFLPIRSDAAAAAVLNI